MIVIHKDAVPIDKYTGWKKLHFRSNAGCFQLAKNSPHSHSPYHPEINDGFIEEHATGVEGEYWTSEYHIFCLHTGIPSTLPHALHLSNCYTDGM